MHTIWSGKSPPGRRAPTCETLGYSGGVETRRKEVGRQIKVARRAKKFRSQRAFADHIGVHENSVANAETGSDRIGASVFEAVERGLDWSIGSIAAYIAGTGMAPWGPTKADQDPQAKPLPPVLSDEEIIAADSRTLGTWFIDLVDAYGKERAEDALFRALEVRKRARAVERGTLAAEA